LKDQLLEKQYKLYNAHTVVSRSCAQVSVRSSAVHLLQNTQTTTYQAALHLAMYDSFPVPDAL